MTLEIMTLAALTILYVCTLVLSWRAGYYTGYDKGVDEGYDAGAVATRTLDRVRRLERRRGGRWTA